MEWMTADELGVFKGGGEKKKKKSGSSSLLVAAVIFAKSLHQAGHQIPNHPSIAGSHRILKHSKGFLGVSHLSCCVRVELRDALSSSGSGRAGRAEEALVSFQKLT